jgi:dienelactone hydrolase
MSKRQFAVRALFLAICGLATACADEGNGQPQDAFETLNADGSDFEVLPESASESDSNVLAQVGGGGDLDRNGPARAASYTAGFPRGADYGGVTVYYPAEGSDLAGVVMCPGFTALRSSIAGWGPFFASHGIVLVTMDTVTTLDPVPQRARGLANALASLKRENTRAGSPLNGRMSADKYGLSGWSMGGGGTWIASNKDRTLKSAVTLAGHNATAGGAGISRGATVPTLMMNGATDNTILGGMGQSEGAYGAIAATTPKILYVMNGEGHFSWGTPRTNGNASGRYMMAWQKTYLLGDESYKSVLAEKGPKAAKWQSANVN